MHTLGLIRRPDMTDITENQTWIEPPGSELKEEAEEVTAQHRRSSHEVETTSRHCVQEQRAVCHYKYSFVQSAASKSHRLIISAVISA